MDLKEFVAATLTQIVEGVAQARQHIANNGMEAQVNPTWRYDTSKAVGSEPSPVEFDVALTVSSESGSANSDKAGGKVGVLSVFSASLSAETEGKQTDQSRSETVSRGKIQGDARATGGCERA